jgi:hypothetical protein
MQSTQQRFLAQSQAQEMRIEKALSTTELVDEPLAIVAYLAAAV